MTVWTMYQYQCGITCEEDAMSKPRLSPERGMCHSGGDLRVHGLLQALLLLRVHEGPRHGYALFKAIRAELPQEMVPGVAVVYRMLRDLEKCGHLRSRLLPGEGGPARKVYTLTPSGERLLAEWYTAIRTRRAALDRFLASYEQAGLEEEVDR